MGKYLLLVVGASSIGMSLVLNRGGGGGSGADSARSAGRMTAVVAEQLSATGLNEGTQWISTLSALPTATTLNGSLMGGTYQTTITPSGTSVVRVRSVGRLSRAGGGVAEHVREASYQLTAGPAAEPALPDFMRCAVTMDRMLTANGGVEVVAESPTYNADVCTNGAGQVNGSSTFQGFLRHGAAINDAGIRARLEAAFRPNQNPSSLPKLQLSPQIAIPYFSAIAHQSRATQSWSGNRSISGTYTLGTRASPTIWYISGDLTTSGPVTFNGYGIILVGGNVNVNSSLITAAGPESTIGLYIQGTLNVNGTATITGQVFANNDLNVSSTSTFTGSITARSGVNFNGGGRINYRKASPALTAPIWSSTPVATGPARLVLSNYCAGQVVAGVPAPCTSS